MLIGFDTNDLTDQMYYDWWQDGNQVLLRSASQARSDRNGTGSPQSQYISIDFGDFQCFLMSKNS